MDLQGAQQNHTCDEGHRHGGCARRAGGWHGMRLIIVFASQPWILRHQHWRYIIIFFVRSHSDCVCTALADVQCHTNASLCVANFDSLFRSVDVIIFSTPLSQHIASIQRFTERVHATYTSIWPILPRQRSLR